MQYVWLNSVLFFVVVGCWETHIAWRIDVCAFVSMYQSPHKLPRFNMKAALKCMKILSQDASVPCRNPTDVCQSDILLPTVFHQVQKNYLEIKRSCERGFSTVKVNRKLKLTVQNYDIICIMFVFLRIL